MIENLLVLSASLIPAHIWQAIDTAVDDDDWHVVFGNHRWSPHEYGFTIFIANDLSELPEMLAETPTWFRPYLKQAVESNCSYINFDSGV